MKRLFVAAAAVLLAGSMTAAAVDPAEAGNNRRGALVAGLIIGGVTAGIVASQLNNHRQYHRGRHVYRQQYYVHRQQRVRFGRGQLWHQHVAYCHNRYRSYNRHNNLFLAYSGQYRHCRSPWIN
jgi:hypothetical protein